MAFGLVVGVVAVGIPHLIAPKSVGEKRETTYESGIAPFGSAWIQFSIAFYLFALIFLAFDVDVLFLFPVILAYDQPALGMRDFVEIALFVGILLLAILFAWRKGAFSWK
jgi:NADH-quinone oxidoreductase subunit A